MKLPILPIIALAAAGIGQGAAGEPVAEIVTFRLNPGISDQDFVKAAAATEGFLKASGGMISRSLSRDGDGLWTDYIEWTSMTVAKSTAAQAMQDPSFGPFMSMINPEGLEMRHAPILLQME